MLRHGDQIDRDLLLLVVHIQNYFVYDNRSRTVNAINLIEYLKFLLKAVLWVSSVYIINERLYFEINHCFLFHYLIPPGSS